MPWYDKMQSLNAAPDSPTALDIHPGTPCGALDGVTVMRYAHIYRHRNSGGVEQYLRHLDHELLRRHSMTILQTYLSRDTDSESVHEETIGKGKIQWIPVPVLHADSAPPDSTRRLSLLYDQYLERYSKNSVPKYPAVVHLIRDLWRQRGGHLRYKTAVLNDHLISLCRENRVDLLALHWLSYETDALIRSAIKMQTPFVYINHFDNARFLLPRTRRSIRFAAAVGSVSARGLPKDVQDKCFDLSDAIDTDFFRPDRARPVKASLSPIVLMPARIQDGKGHHDLIQAVGLLAARGIDLAVCFAGAVDSEFLCQDLRRLAARVGIEPRVQFLGERPSEDIRDLYAQSRIVVLPTYSEGLGRVLLEAQAMERPVIAYDSGGTSEAIRPGETGFLISKGNVQDLADRISLLLRDEAMAVRMGERGREFVSCEFGLTALTQRHEIFYRTALTGVFKKLRPNRP